MVRIRAIVAVHRWVVRGLLVMVFAGMSRVNAVFNSSAKMRKASPKCAARR